MSSDGKIWFESEHGQGSTFHFTSRFGLPSPLPATDSVAPTPDADLIHSPSAHAASLKILLVEDNPANQLLTVRLLQKRGHHVTVANSGLAGIRKWEVETFDLILMDGQMSEMDGFQATAIIREKERSRGAQLPIVAITAHAMAGDKDDCQAGGMDDYVSKPIHFNELFAAIDCVLPGKQSSQSQSLAPARKPRRPPRRVAISILRPLQIALLRRFDVRTGLLDASLG